MTDHPPTNAIVSIDNNIQWMKETSTNGFAFEVGVVPVADLPNILEASSTGTNGVPDESSSNSNFLPDLAGSTNGPTFKAYGISVHWPVDENHSWQSASGNVAALGITRYRVVYDDSGPFFDYRIDITINAGKGLRFGFEDEDGDYYTVRTWTLGDHYVRFNSKKPTIVRIARHD